MPIYDDYRKFEDPTLSFSGNIAKQTGEGLSEGLSSGLQMLNKRIADKMVRKAREEELQDLLGGRRSYKEFSDDDRAMLAEFFPAAANELSNQQKIDQEKQNFAQKQQNFAQKQLDQEKKANQQEKQFESRQALIINKSFMNHMSKLSDNYFPMQMSLNDMETAVKHGKINVLDKLADIGGFRFEFLKSPGAKSLETGLKTYFLNTIGSVSARPNMYIEMQIRRMLPSIQNSKTANLAIINILRANQAIVKQKIDIYNRLLDEDMKEFGYVRSNIQQRVEKELEEFSIMKLAEVAREADPDGEEFFNTPVQNGYVKALSYDGKEKIEIPENESEKFKDKGYLILDNKLLESFSDRKAPSKPKQKDYLDKKGNLVVFVSNPKGQAGTIPKEKLEQYLKRGYKLLSNVPEELALKQGYRRAPQPQEQTAQPQGIPQQQSQEQIAQQPVEQIADQTANEQSSLNDFWDSLNNSGKSETFQYVLREVINQNNGPQVIEAYNRLSENDKLEIEFWYNTFEDLKNQGAQQQPQEMPQQPPQEQTAQQLPQEQEYGLRQNQQDLQKPQISGSPGYQVLQQERQAADPTPDSANMFNADSKNPNLPSAPEKFKENNSDFVPLESKKSEESKIEEIFLSVFNEPGITRSATLFAKNFVSGVLGGLDFEEKIVDRFFGTEMPDGEKIKYQAEHDAFKALRDPNFKNRPYLEQYAIIENLNAIDNEVDYSGVIKNFSFGTRLNGKPINAFEKLKKDYENVFIEIGKKTGIDVNPKNDFERIIIKETAEAIGSTIVLTGFNVPLLLATVTPAIAKYTTYKITESEEAAEKAEAAAVVAQIAVGVGSLGKAAYTLNKAKKIAKGFSKVSAFKYASKNIVKSEKEIQRLTNKIKKAAKKGDRNAVSALTQTLQNEQNILIRNQSIEKLMISAKKGDPSAIQALYSEQKKILQNDLGKLLQGGENLNNVAKQTKLPLRKTENFKNLSSYFGNDEIALNLTEQLKLQNVPDGIFKEIGKSVHPKNRVKLMSENYDVVKGIAENLMEQAGASYQKLGNLNSAELAKLGKNLGILEKETQNIPVKTKEMKQALEMIDSIKETWFPKNGQGKASYYEIFKTIQNINAEINWGPNKSKDAIKVKRVFSEMLKEKDPKLFKVYQGTNKFYSSFKDTVLEPLYKNPDVIQEAKKTGLSIEKVAEKWLANRLGNKKPFSSMFSNIEGGAITAALIHGRFAEVGSYLVLKHAAKGVNKIVKVLENSQTLKKVAPKIGKYIKAGNQDKAKKVLIKTIKILKKENPEVDFTPLELEIGLEFDINAPEKEDVFIDSRFLG